MEGGLNLRKWTMEGGLNLQKYVYIGGRLKPPEVEVPPGSYLPPVTLSRRAWALATVVVIQRVSGVFISHM